MAEQEHYKKLLKKVIDATENDKIKTPEELIQVLIHELTNISDFDKEHLHSRTLVNWLKLHSW